MLRLGDGILDDYVGIKQGVVRFGRGKVKMCFVGLLMNNPVSAVVAESNHRRTRQQNPGCHLRT